MTDTIEHAALGGDAGVREAQFSIQEREDTMLIAERDWQWGWRCIAKRPTLMTNEEWRPTAERIVAALRTTDRPVGDMAVREALVERLRAAADRLCYTAENSADTYALNDMNAVDEAIAALRTIPLLGNGER